MELKKKIDYENGQINKLPILTTDTGSITLLAFDKGTELDTHAAPCDVMLLIIDGTGVITLEGNDMVLKEGEFLTMRKGVQHSVRAEKKFKMVLTKLGN
ncbi:MAG: cupin domain-containing protein [Prevotella sp.]|nr:cupin domain-containing protein [Bacteroides sp.]MCM1366114.1 cupin domain-containing protein [Prevotella sp.]MCM1437523.1 cupin domain-containing protein [Prevotella sp.]